MIEAPSPRCGSATWMALMVPIRLVFITSIQACQIGGSLHARDAGRRDDDVELAQLGDAVFEGRPQLAGVAHVDLRRDDALAGLLDELRGLLEVLRCRHRVADRREVLTPVDGDDVGALLGQPNRVAAALPARGAGDEGDLSLNASH